MAFYFENKRKSQISMLFFAWFFCQVKRNFVKTIFGRTKDTLLQENSWTDDKTLTSHIVIRSHPWLLQRNFCHASEDELAELIQLVCAAHGLVWSDHKTQAWSSHLMQRHPRKARHRLLTLYKIVRTSLLQVQTRNLDKGHYCFCW